MLSSSLKCDSPQSQRISADALLSAGYDFMARSSRGISPHFTGGSCAWRDDINKNSAAHNMLIKIRRQEFMLVPFPVACVSDAPTGTAVSFDVRSLKSRPDFIRCGAGRKNYPRAGLCPQSPFFTQNVLFQYPDVNISFAKTAGKCYNARRGISPAFAGNLLMEREIPWRSFPGRNGFATRSNDPQKTK